MFRGRLVRFRGKLGYWITKNKRKVFLEAEKFEKSNQETRKAVVESNLLIKNLPLGMNSHRLYAILGGEKVGIVDYEFNKKKKQIKIADITTSEKFRRSGIATKMYQKIQSITPKNDINFGELTEDGEALLRKIGKIEKHTNEKGFDWYSGKINPEIKKAINKMNKNKR